MNEHCWGNSHSNTLLTMFFDLFICRKVFLPIQVYFADCSKRKDICENLKLTKLPKWVLFKKQGSYEIYHGLFLLYQTNSVFHFSMIKFDSGLMPY